MFHYRMSLNEVGQLTIGQIVWLREQLRHFQR